MGRKTTEHSPLGEVDIGLLADQVGVAATNTLDLGQGVHDLLLAINVGVEQTQNVLEVALLSGDERCIGLSARRHCDGDAAIHTHDGQLVVGRSSVGAVVDVADARGVGRGLFGSVGAFAFFPKFRPSRAKPF